MTTDLFKLFRDMRNIGPLDCKVNIFSPKVEVVRLEWSFQLGPLEKYNKKRRFFQMDLDESDFSDDIANCKLIRMALDIQATIKEHEANG